MKEKYIVLEKNIENKTISPIWGPFNSHAEAADFAHRRMSMFCDEWCSEEDGFLLEYLNWEIRELTKVQ